MYAGRGGAHSAGDLSPVRLHLQRRRDTGSPSTPARGSPSSPLRPSRTLEPLPLRADRPSSGSDASQAARNAEVNPPTVRRFFFSADGLDKRSKKLPAAHHYDVLLQEGDGTEGPNLQDEIQCRYVDFLAAAAGGEVGGLKWTDPSLDDVMKVAEFLDRCAPRTRLDGYPMYVILKDVLHRLLRGEIAATSQREAELRAQVATLQSSLGAAAASHMMLKRQSEQLRGRLQTIEHQLGDLASKETGLRDKLWASTNELAQASAELAESQTELDGKGEGATAKFGGMLRQVVNTGSIADSFGVSRGNSMGTGSGSAAAGGTSGKGSQRGSGPGSNGAGAAGGAGRDGADGANSGAGGAGEDGAGEVADMRGTGGQHGSKVDAQSDSNSNTDEFGATQASTANNFATIGAALGAVALGSFGAGARSVSDGPDGSNTRRVSSSGHEGGSASGSHNTSGQAQVALTTASGSLHAGRLSGMVSGVMSASNFASGNGAGGLPDAVAELPPSELNDLVSQLPPKAIESLMLNALEGAPNSTGNGAVQTSMFRALIASGQVDADAIRDAVQSLTAEQRRVLLQELWDEFGGPNDRTTMEHLHGGIGIGPDDIARMVADSWDDWGSRFLMSLLHRIGSDPVELLQGLMRELAPRKAAATEAVVDMADGIRDQLSDATNSVADAFSASWGSGAVMGRDVKDGLDSLISELESQTGDHNSKMKLRSLQALAATLELGDSSASDAFLRLVGAGDAVGVGRFLMKAVARDIAGEDLGDAEAGSKMRKEDFAEFASQAFGNGDTPNGMLMGDIGDQLSGSASGIDLDHFESIVLPSDGVDEDNQPGSDTSNFDTRPSGQEQSGSRARGALTKAARHSSLKMGLWMGSTGGSDESGRGRGRRNGNENSGSGSSSGSVGGSRTGGAAHHGREVGTQTTLSGDAVGISSDFSAGNSGGHPSTEASTGSGPDHDRMGTAKTHQDAQGGKSSIGDGGAHGDNNGRDSGGNHGSIEGSGFKTGLHADMTTEEMGQIDAAAKERGKRLLVKRNKSLAFINKSLSLPPGKQPKPKPSNRGLVVRQINQMFEDKVVADEIDDKENNPRTSLPEFIHEHLIAKYGLKKLADKNFRELIFAVNLHAKAGKHYDERISLFSSLCGMTDMENFSPDACDVVLEVLKLLVSNVKQISEVLGHELLLDFDRSVDAVGKAFVKYGISIRQETVVAVLAEVTDHVTRQMPVDDLLMQTLQIFRQTRKAVDELLTARFRKFDEDQSQDLSLDELSELIASVDPDGSVTHREVSQMYRELIEESSDADDDSSGAQMDLASFLFMCHTHSIGRRVGSLAQQSTEDNKYA